MMSEKAIRELTASELNEVTGGFFDPVSVGLGIMVGLDAIVFDKPGSSKGRLRRDPLRAVVRQVTDLGPAFSGAEPDA